MHIKVVDQVSKENYLGEAWKLYDGAFRELNSLAVQRHLMYDWEFEEVMGDQRVQKYLCLDDGGTLRGLSTYTNILTAVPLISPEYFQRRWPDLYDQKKIWYCGFVAVRPDGQHHHAFAALVEAMYQEAADRNGIIGLDFCQYNDDTRNMSRVIRRMLQRLSGDVHAERMDQQQYWLYQFPSAA
jgi:hypothetical protein